MYYSNSSQSPFQPKSRSAAHHTRRLELMFSASRGRERGSNFHRYQTTQSLAAGNDRTTYEIFFAYRQDNHWCVVIKERNPPGEDLPRGGELHQVRDQRMYEVVSGWTNPTALLEINNSQWNLQSMGKFSGVWLSYVRFLLESTPLSSGRTRCDTWTTAAFLRLSSLADITGVKVSDVEANVVSKIKEEKPEEWSSYLERFESRLYLNREPPSWAKMAEEQRLTVQKVLQTLDHLSQAMAEGSSSANAHPQQYP